MDGPPVTLGDPQAVETWFQAPEVGPEGASLAFELTITATDGSESEGISLVNISETASPPVADAGPDRKAAPAEIVMLSRTRSADPDGKPLDYAWEQIQGSPVALSDPKAVQPVFVAPEVEGPGESLVFELTVTDAAGLQEKDKVAITA